MSPIKDVWARCRRFAGIVLVAAMNRLKEKNRKNLARQYEGHSARGEK
jgi:hypothetical protein